jgi:hypothetical protein
LLGTLSLKPPEVLTDREILSVHKRKSEIRLNQIIKTEGRADLALPFIYAHFK